MKDESIYALHALKKGMSFSNFLLNILWPWLSINIMSGLTMNKLFQLDLQTWVRVSLHM